MLVFISYAHADAAFADKLVADLQSRGIPIWYDKLSIQPGQRWDKAVEDGLNNATHVIYIMSVASVASDNCLDEIDSALTDKKKVLPILLEECNRPLRVRRIQYTDFRGNYDAQFASLMAILAPDMPQAQAAQPSAAAAAATVPALRIPASATPADLVAQIGQQLTRSGESYRSAQQALIALAQAAPAANPNGWRDSAFDPQTDTNLAQIVVESSDEQITRDVALLIAELRSIKAVTWLATQVEQGNQRALLGLALIRGEAGLLPPEVPLKLQGRIFDYLVIQQLLAHPERIIYRFLASAIGAWIALSGVIYATFNGLPTDALRSGLGLGALIGALIGVIVTLTLQIGQSKEIASARTRILVSGLLGTILAFIVFVWLRLFIYNGEFSFLFVLWALLFAAGFAVSPLFDGEQLNGILFKVGFAALGVFAALYLSARVSAFNPVIYMGNAEQPLFLSLFAAVFLAIFAFIPELTAYIRERVRRASRVAQQPSTGA